MNKVVVSRPFEMLPLQPNPNAIKVALKKMTAQLKRVLLWSNTEEYDSWP